MRKSIESFCCVIGTMSIAVQTCLAISACEVADCHVTCVYRGTTLCVSVSTPPGPPPDGYYWCCKTWVGICPNMLAWYEACVKTE